MEAEPSAPRLTRLVVDGWERAATSRPASSDKSYKDDLLCCPEFLVRGVNLMRDALSRIESLERERDGLAAELARVKQRETQGGVVFDLIVAEARRERDEALANYERCAKGSQQTLRNLDEVFKERDEARAALAAGAGAKLRELRDRCHAAAMEWKGNAETNSSNTPYWRGRQWAAEWVEQEIGRALTREALAADAPSEGAVPEPMPKHLGMEWIKAPKDTRCLDHGAPLVRVWTHRATFECGCSHWFGTPEDAAKPAAPSERRGSDHDRAVCEELQRELAAKHEVKPAVQKRAAIIAETWLKTYKREKWSGEDLVNLSACLARAMEEWAMVAAPSEGAAKPDAAQFVLKSVEDWAGSLDDEIAAVTWKGDLLNQLSKLRRYLDEGR